MTEEQENSEIFKGIVMDVQQGVMNATPSIWSNGADPMNFEPDLEVTVATDAAVPIGESPVPPSPGDEWLYERTGELTGEVDMDIAGTTTSDPTIITVTGNTTNWKWIQADDLRALMERSWGNDLPEVGQPTDPQDGFEASSPLRAEVFQGDDMGSQSDPGLEMGEAEEWFRDKVRVRT